MQKRSETRLEGSYDPGREDDGAQRGELRGRKQGSHIRWRDTEHGYTPEQRQRVRQLRFWQKRVRQADCETVQHARNEIQRMCSALGLDKNRTKHAEIIYVRARKEEIQYRRSIEEVATASVYLAARSENLPLCVDEIEHVSHTDADDFLRASRAIQRSLDVKLTPTDPEEYVSQYASDLRIPPGIQSKITKTISETKEQLAGHSPPNIAAAAIYAVSLTEPSLSLSQQEVAEATPISTGSLSNTYYPLYETASELE